MTDNKGNTPQDRRAVALSEEHERRHFIDQFVEKHPDFSRDEVEAALDKAAEKIAPSEGRDALTEAVEKAIGTPKP